MKTKPWVAIDLFTGEMLGQYETEVVAMLRHRGQAVSIQYEPSARKMK